MNSAELKERTKKFAIDIISLIEGFPNSMTSRTIANQLIRSATSVGANYRATCRAQSIAHFISKISIVEEEADESLFWLELSVDAGLVSNDIAEPFLREANELTAIFASSRKTAKLRKYKK